MSAVRGLTTGELLHLAAIIVRNAAATGQPGADNRVQLQGGSVLAKANKQGGRVVPQNVGPLLRGLDGWEGLPLPANKSGKPSLSGTDALKDLTEADLIQGGGAAEARRGKGDMGAVLESYRQAILAFVQANSAYLTNQQAWPASRVPGSPAGTPYVANSGSALDKLFNKSSGVPVKPKTFQARIAALQQRFNATGAQEPVDIVKSGGGVGVRRFANAVEARAAIDASNGFVQKNLGGFLTKGRLNRLQAGLGDRLEGSSPAQKWQAVVQALGAQNVLSALWNVASVSSLNSLLGGYNLAKAVRNAGGNSWAWDPSVGADASNPDGNPAGYTRAIFEALANAYNDRGVGGQDRGNRVSSGRRTGPTGSQGVYGVSHSSIAKLNGSDLASVATFGRNAKQGRYSMAALQAGAQKLGLSVDQNALLHDTVIAQIREGIVRSLAGRADQGDAGAAKAVGAVLGLSGQVTADAISRKLNAEYGLRSSSQCNKQVYSVADLQSIAKAHLVPTSGADGQPLSHAELCRALAAVGVDAGAPGLILSDRRGMEEQVSSGRRPTQPGGRTLLPGLGGTVQQTVFGGGNTLAPPSLSQPTSPRLSSGRVSGAGSPRLSGSRSGSPRLSGSRSGSPRLGGSGGLTGQSTESLFGQLQRGGGL